MQRALFLTWLEHRRTRALCERLNLPLVELISTRRGVARYAELAYRTLSVLRQRRPRVLIVQTPSQVLGLLALVLRPFFSYRLILDAHNEAVEPFLHPSAAVQRLTRLLLRRANRVIVTNSMLAQVVEQHGGSPLVLPDALPRLPATGHHDREGGFKIVVISTFAGDEPIEAVMAAAGMLEEDTRLFVTGNSTKCPESIRNRLPRNVSLTGFLPEEGYWSLIASADAVMDLTTMDNCLVCGAYEAVAAGKPLVLSDNAATRELFGAFGELTDNTPQGIAAAVRRLRARIHELRDSIPARRNEFNARWERQAASIGELIAKHCA